MGYQFFFLLEIYCTFFNVLIFFCDREQQILSFLYFDVVRCRSVIGCELFRIMTGVITWYFPEIFRFYIFVLRFLRCFLFVFLLDSFFLVEYTSFLEPIFILRASRNNIKMRRLMMVIMLRAIAKGNLDFQWDCFCNKKSIC